MRFKNYKTNRKFTYLTIFKYKISEFFSENAKTIIFVLGY